MTLIARLFEAVSTALLLAPVQSWAQNIEEVTRGLALAQQVCAECHAVDKLQARSPNNAAPRFETIAKVAGMTSIALNAALQTSHRSMPNLILEEDQRRTVIAYILSLK
jgi:mono/diheme cytochrome c family protein